eukprot:10957076-Alexandrium_andersonii.AAC.2
MGASHGHARGRIGGCPRKCKSVRAYGVLCVRVSCTRASEGACVRASESAHGLSGGGGGGGGGRLGMHAHKFARASFCPMPRGCLARSPLPPSVLDLADGPLKQPCSPQLGAWPFT